MSNSCFHALYREVRGIDPLACNISQLVPLSYLYHDLHGSVFITQDETDYGSCKQIYQRSQAVAARIRECLKTDLSLCDRAEAIRALPNAYYTVLDIQWLNEALSQTEELARATHESCSVLETTALNRLFSMYAHYVPDSVLHERATDQARTWAEIQLPSGSWGGEFSDTEALAVLYALNEYGYLTQDDRYEDTVARGLAYYFPRVATNIRTYDRTEKMYSLGLLYWLRLTDAPGSHTVHPTCREIASQVYALLGKEEVASTGWLQGVTIYGNYTTEKMLDELSVNLSTLQPDASGERPA